MDICQITLITLNQKCLLVVPDTLSETLLCSIQLLSTNMRDIHCLRVINGNTNCISLPVNVNKFIVEKVATNSFLGCKIYAKNAIIESDQDACTLINCYICQNSQLPQHYYLSFC